ncbi:hypothetical protein F5Y08DRAFT_351634 [Xylaria arbuscula]|nr:hypothetical protein F5Y08DRAFT_351634 [Xylaria arbuscula]
MTTRPPNTSESAPSHPQTEPPPNKRTAEDSLLDPSSKRCCLPQISLTLFRLYVHPWLWTARHLELLGYQFVRSSNGQFRDQTQHQCQEEPPTSLRLPSKKRIYALLNYLRFPVCRGSKAGGIKRFFEEYGVAWGRTSPLKLYFERQAVATIRPSSIFFHPSRGPNLVFLDLARLKRHRDNYIGLSMVNDISGPVWHIKQKKQRRLQPANEAEDPYVVTALIALAQGVYYMDQRRKQTMDSSSEHLEPVSTSLDPSAIPVPAADYNVRLLAFSEDGETLYFYTASIPLTSIRMFDNPSHYYDNNGVRVHYYSIKVTPCEESEESIKDMLRNLVLVKNFI